MFNSLNFLRSTVEGSWLVLVYDAWSNSDFPDSAHFWYSSKRLFFVWWPYALAVHHTKLMKLDWQILSVSGFAWNWICVDLWEILRPRVVYLSFIVTRTHQKIKALFCCINFDYTTSFVKKCFVFQFFSFEYKKRKAKYTLNSIVLQIYFNI